MRAPSIQPPADAAERRSRRPVIAYDVQGLPAFDATFYARARANESVVAADLAGWQSPPRSPYERSHGAG